MKNKRRNAFTLIELLVVIAIIAILSVVVVLTLNPAELLRQSRDSGRISDLSTLRTATSLYLADVTSPNLASSSFGYAACYLSSLTGVGTTTTKCGTFQSASYTTDASTTNLLYRKIDGTGWIPVNFSSISEGSPFGSLPVDPSNNASYYYAYAATSSGGYYFKLTALMESKKYNASGTNDVVSTDGGQSNTAYEIGNNLAL